MLTLNPDLIPPRPPDVFLREAPADQMSVVWSLSGHLSNVSDFAKQYTASLALFDFCSQNARAAMDEMMEMPFEQRRSAIKSVWDEWIFIAARAAVLAVRNCGLSLHLAQKVAGQVAAWEIDGAPLKAARKSFEAEFPAAELARHSVAHPEHYPNPRRNTGAPNSKLQSIISGGGEGVSQISNMLNGNVFTATFEGELVTCEISAAKALKLASIVRDFFGPFESLKVRENQTDH